MILKTNMSTLMNKIATNIMYKTNEYIENNCE
jgi:hypothetical protein